MKISKYASVERTSNCNHYNARDDGMSKKCGGWTVEGKNRNRKSDLFFFVGKNLRGRGAPVPLALEVEMSGCMS